MTTQLVHTPLRTVNGIAITYVASDGNRVYFDGCWTPLVKDDVDESADYLLVLNNWEWLQPFCQNHTLHFNSDMELRNVVQLLEVYNKAIIRPLRDRVFNQVRNPNVVADRIPPGNWHELKVAAGSEAMARRIVAAYPDYAWDGDVRRANGL